MAKSWAEAMYLKAIKEKERAEKLLKHLEEIGKLTEERKAYLLEVIEKGNRAEKWLRSKTQSKNG